MSSSFGRLYALAVLISTVLRGQCSLWSEWWNYQSISGPAFWGISNSDWRLCSKGKNQSPINIDPTILLFDPGLKHLVVEGEEVTGSLQNRGHDITFDVDEVKTAVNFTLGPLSYKYRLKLLKFHFGHDNNSGSEHHIGQRSFPAEIQLISYNTDLYKNITHAERSPRGIAVIALFVQIQESDNDEFSVISKLLQDIQFKDDRVEIEALNLKNIIPNSMQYITYEGSLTYPGCYETVTWLLINKPIYIGLNQINLLRETREGGRENPQAFMAGNTRPLMPVNQRTIRTNINFSRGCSMERDMNYKESPMTMDTRKSFLATTEMQKCLLYRNFIYSIL
ncbi:hypothetical protein ScPMuIL_010917 [Solemya velum]